MASIAEQLAKAVASSSLKLSQDLTLQEIHDGGSRAANEGEIDPSDFIVMADVSVPFTGEVPDSARILNAIVTEWVMANAQAVDAAIRQPVGDYLAEYYPEIDLGSVLGSENLLIWEDQVDYRAAYNQEDNLIHFTVETLLDLE